MVWSLLLHPERNKIASVKWLCYKTAQQDIWGGEKKMGGRLYHKSTRSPLCSLPAVVLPVYRSASHHSTTPSATHPRHHATTPAPHHDTGDPPPPLVPHPRRHLLSQTQSVSLQGLRRWCSSASQLPVFSIFML
jgi:hypothetical protein